MAAVKATLTLTLYADDKMHCSMPMHHKPDCLRMLGAALIALGNDMDQAQLAQAGGVDLSEILKRGLLGK